MIEPGQQWMSPEGDIVTVRGVRGWLDCFSKKEQDTLLHAAQTRHPDVKWYRGTVVCGFDRG